MLYRILNKNKQINAFIYLQIIFESCFGMIINVIFLTSPWIQQSIVGLINSYKNKEDFNSLMPIREESKYSSSSGRETLNSYKDKNY